MLFHAIELATKLHFNQYRKDKITPYICHPLEVVNRLTSWGIKDNDILCAAVLHDVIEDCGYTYEQIIKNISYNTAIIVQELTYYPENDKKEYLLSFKDKFIESLKIKIADRICNINDFSRAKDGYTKKYIEKSQPLFKIVIDRKNEIKEYDLIYKDMEKYVENR